MRPIFSLSLSLSLSLSFSLSRRPPSVLLCSARPFSPSPSSPLASRYLRQVYWLTRDGFSPPQHSSSPYEQLILPAKIIKINWQTNTNLNYLIIKMLCLNKHKKGHKINKVERVSCGPYYMWHSMEKRKGGGSRVREYDGENSDLKIKWARI